VSFHVKSTTIWIDEEEWAGFHRFWVTTPKGLSSFLKEVCWVLKNYFTYRPHKPVVQKDFKIATLEKCTYS
jgi:hypothetical protein